MDGRSAIPTTGFVVKPVLDGEAILLGDPLSPELIRTLTAQGPLVELWAWWRNETGNSDLLRSFPDLQRLHIINRTQDNLCVLSELKGLRVLTIESNTIVDVDMAFWPELEELAFTWNGKFDNLRKAKSLATLRVWSWKQSDLTLLSSAPQLRVLQLVRGPIRSLHGVEACNELETLSLSHLSKLENFDAISALKSLRTLSIESCRGLKRLDNLAPLSRLQTLSLANLGQIASLSPLLANSNLRKIFFPGSTDIIDGDTAVLDRLPIVDFAFQNRKHYNYNYNHRETRAERKASREAAEGSAS